MTSRFVLAPCVRFGYNSLNSCWFCDEKHLLSCCAARDTHFSAFIVLDGCSINIKPQISMIVPFCRTVYERPIPFIPPVLWTFLVSAWWHGFYPSYYMSFMFLGGVTIAARKARFFNIVTRWFNTLFVSDETSVMA